jgi:hypothetical protein
MPPELKFTKFCGGGWFEVFGFVRVHLSGPLWWHTEESDGEQARGPFFRAYDGSGKSERELGYVGIMEVNADPQEPDVTSLNDTEIGRFDAFLERQVGRMFADDGRNLVKWHGSVRNSVKLWDCTHLVTAYTGHDPAVGDRVYMDARTTAHGKRLGLMTCFNVGLSEQQTSAIMSSWLSIRVLSELQ